MLVRYTVVDAVRFFPKKVWQEAGGFDENLTGPEDWDFDKRVKMKGEVGIITSTLYHNEVNFNLGITILVSISK